MHAASKRLMCVASTMYVHGLNLCTVEPLSDQDTNGAEESFVVSEVSSVQECPHKRERFHCIQVETIDML